jgi:hypothetical protein
VECHCGSSCLFAKHLQGFLNAKLKKSCHPDLEFCCQKSAAFSDSNNLVCASKRKSNRVFGRALQKLGVFNT